MRTINIVQLTRLSIETCVEPSMLAKKAEHNRLRKLLRRLLRKLLRMLLRKLLRKLLCKLLCKKKLLRGSLSIIAGFCWVLHGSDGARKKI